MEVFDDFVSSDDLANLTERCCWPVWHSAIDGTRADSV